MTFMYLPAGKGRATLAIHAFDTYDGCIDCVVGVAFCSPKDQFTRDRGRTIALGRAMKEGSQFRFFFVAKPKEVKERAEKVFRDWLDYNDPSRDNTHRIDLPSWVYAGGTETEISSSGKIVGGHLEVVIRINNEQAVHYLSQGFVEALLVYFS